MIFFSALHPFARKAIKIGSCLVLTFVGALLVLIAGLNIFLKNPSGQEWIALKVQQALAEFEEGEIKVSSIRPTSPRTLRIEGLCLYNKDKQLAAKAPTIELQISLMQLFRARMPLSLVKIPLLELDKEALQKFSAKQTDSTPSLHLPSSLLIGDTQAEIHHIVINDSEHPHLWQPLSACSRLTWSPLSVNFELDLIEKQESQQPQLHLHFYHGLTGSTLEIKADQIHALSFFAPTSFLSEFENSEILFLGQTESSLQQTLFSPYTQYRIKATAYHKTLLKPFEFSGDGKIDFESFSFQQNWKAQAPGLKADGNLSWTPQEFLTAEAVIEMKSEEKEECLVPLQTQNMRMNLFLNTSNWLGRATLGCELFQWQELSPARDLKIDLNWLSPSHIFASSEAVWLNHPFKSQIELHRLRSGEIEMEVIDITAPQLQFQLLPLQEKRWHLKGNIAGALVTDIAKEIGFEKLFANSIDVEANLSPQTNSSTFEGDFTLHVKEAGLSGFTCNRLQAQATGEIHLKEPNQSTLKNLIISSRQLRKKGRLLMDHVEGTLWGNPKALFYNIHLKKEPQFEGLDAPFDLQSQGFIDLGFLDFLQESKTERPLRIGVDKLNGSWSNLKARLLDPCVLVLDSKSAQIQGFHLDIGEGLWKGWAHMGPEGIQISSEMYEVPADLLQFLTGRTVWGHASGLIELDLRPHHCQAQVDMRLRKLQVSELKADLPPVDGHLKIDWHEDQIKASAKLFNINDALSCSLEGELHPPASFPEWKELKGDVNLSLEGRLGLFSYFFTSEDFDFDGRVQGALHIKGTGRRPMTKGQIAIHQGSYDHYSIGLTLRNADAHLTGRGTKIHLDHLKATDGAHGLASAYGDLSLLNATASHSFLTFDKFRFLHIPFVSAKANGSCEFLHKGKGAKLKGDVDLEEVQVRIPDQLPSPVPQLDAYNVVYETDTLTASDPSNEETFTGKVEFDLLAKIPTATVKGRGLNTVWKGEVHLKGDDEEPLLRGHIDLSGGDFKFANKHFIVKEGYLDFAGNLKTESSIHMIAEMMVDQITLRAILNGPLDKPRLQFRSTPNLSTADFFSYLLFSQPHSSLSGFQTLQVAQIALEASADGTESPFTQFQKNTGIDRLEVSSKEALGNDHDGDLYTVKVGKYLSNGILVGVSKDVSAEGTQITFEVDLTKHLSLITEIGYLTSSSINLMWKKEY